MTNELKALRCGTPAHGDMAQLLNAAPEGVGPWSMWICQRCGLLAVHLEAAGDIFWYDRQSSTRVHQDLSARVHETFARSQEDPDGIHP